MRDSSTAGLSKHLNGRRTLLLHRHGDALILKPFLCAQAHSDHRHFERPCSTKPWEHSYFADCQDVNGEDEGPMHRNTSVCLKTPDKLNPASSFFLISLAG